MNNYVVGADGINREIPGVFQETFTNDIIMPSKTSNGTYTYDMDFGSIQVARIRTVPNEESNKKFNELYGYLKGRGWVSEIIVLARNNGEIEGYLRIETVETNMQGTIKNKRAMDIVVYQKF